MVDVAIIGAGPAGCAAALALRHSKLSVAIIDRAVFPRDKTCGDALPGRTFRYVNELVPGSAGVFSQIESKQVLDSSAVYVKGRKILNKKWVLKAVNSPRIDFDHYLFSAVKKHTDAQVVEGQRITEITRAKNSFTLKDQNGEEIVQARTVVVAVGANATLREQIIGQKVNTGGYEVAVSQYFKNVNVSSSQNHLFVPSKQKLPGYFWIFPVGNDLFNVGYGLLSEKKVPVAAMFQEIIDEDRAIRKVLSNATPVGKVRGHKLPFPSFSWPLVAERALIVGDAAELMDPLLGHGIDKAMLSGIIAAETLIEAFDAQDWSKEFLNKYQSRVEKEIYPEIKSNGRLLKRLYPIMRLINAL